jgi:hypothetical protein
MTPDDVRVIFTNVEELAIFADMFAERIEASIGDALTPSDYPASSSPHSIDSVGALFLEVVRIRFLSQHHVYL